MTQPQVPATTHSDRIRRLGETRRQVLMRPPDQAMDVILDYPEPAALVHSFPEEDLHFLIHDIGPVDALPLIALASNRQWDYLLDVETWNKDRLDYPQATAWLQLLFQADADRLVEWCFDERLEFLELYLFRNIEVHLREPDQAPSDFGDGFFTDDDTFYVRLIDYPVATPEEQAVKSQRNEILVRLLRHLSAFDHARYQGLLMESVGVIPGETEEELFRLRNVRLSEKGFLPFHEAIGVYQPLRPGDLAARGRKKLRPPAADGQPLPIPQFAATFLAGDNLFVRALKGIEDPYVIQQLQVELAGLCNQIISADQKVIRVRDQLRQVVTRASSFLSIGLELMTEGSAGSQEARASELLQRHLLADIFRTGFASALALKWQATNWRQKSWYRTQQLDLTFWDEAWLGLLGGLLIDRPKFYDPSSSTSNYRDFHSYAEIAATARSLQQVMAIDGLFQQMGIVAASVKGTRPLTYLPVLLTLWARAWLKLPPPPAHAPSLAIPLSAFRDFYAALWSDHGGRRIIGDDVRTAFLEWTVHTSGQAAENLSDGLGDLFQDLFDEIERELAPVRTGNLDPHHIHLFLLKP